MKDAKEFAWIANSFLMAAQQLAETGVKDRTNDAYASRVPIYLAHHGLELTFKAALRALGVVAPRTHDLSRLAMACRQACPVVEIAIPDVLLEAGAGLTGDLFGWPEESKPVQQELRYPSSPQFGARLDSLPISEFSLLAQIELLRRQCHQVILPLVHGSTDFRAQAHWQEINAQSELRRPPPAGA